MPRRAILFCLFTLVPIFAYLRAQTTVESPITWITHTVKSKTLGSDRQYFVSLPPNYTAGGNARHPVLLLLDANDQPHFVAALANIRFLTSQIGRASCRERV